MGSQSMTPDAGRAARAAAEAHARQAVQAVDLSLPLSSWLADQLMRFRAQVLEGYHCACCSRVTVGDLHREQGGAYEGWKGSD